MLRFLGRDVPGVGQVCYPGSAPPPAEAFRGLLDRRIEIETRAAGDALWQLQLRHPDWGEATLAGVRDAPRAGDLVRFAGNLTDAEKANAGESESSVVLTVPAKRRHALHDRKLLLRFMSAVMGDDGVVAIDMASQLAWSPAALEDELAHDADLDVEALYSIHQVFDPDAPEPRVPYWLHTHGLEELGAFDLDVVAPHADYVERCGEPFRAIAFMALEGAVSPDTARLEFGHPGGEARLVPADRFMRDAAPELARLRDAGDHDGRRSVLCEPAGRRLFGLGRGDALRPMAFARRRPPEQFAVYYSEAATSLMGDRARRTIGVLEARRREFAEFDVPALVKLGYPTPDGKREHLWFELHGIDGDRLDCTLVNRPFSVSLREGERDQRPLELLTDWVVITPTGQITPRSDAASRRMREHLDELREAKRRAGDGAPNP